MSETDSVPYQSAQSLRNNSFFPYNQTVFYVLGRLAPYTSFRFVTFCQTTIAFEKRGEKSSLRRSNLIYICCFLPHCAASSQFPRVLLSLYNIFDLSAFIVIVKVFLENRIQATYHCLCHNVTRNVIIYK